MNNVISRAREFPFRLVIATIAFVAILTGCGVDKATEQFRDAPRGETNNTEADIVTMPDGFSNLATKCDHGNRIYVAFKGDANRAAITVVANDPTCGGG